MTSTTRSESHSILLATASSSGASSCSKFTNSIIETTGAQIDSDSRRLWIGNLDPKLTEFYLLKLVQSFGTIDNFDFLFHRTGQHIGKPRGYAFVTYNDKVAAQKCLAELDSKRILDRTISVRWAHQTSYILPDEEEKIRNKIPALGIKPVEKPLPLSKSKAILAIEAKLKAMERDKPNFNLTSTFRSKSCHPESTSSRNSTMPYDKTQSKRSAPK